MGNCKDDRWRLKYSKTHIIETVSGDIRKEKAEKKEAEKDKKAKYFNDAMLSLIREGKSKEEIIEILRRDFPKRAEELQLRKEDGTILMDKLPAQVEANINKYRKSKNRGEER